MQRLSVVLVVLLALALIPAGVEAKPKPYLVHGGLGFVKALNDGAPGGSIGLQGGVLYRLEQSPEIGIGGELGYFLLGTESVDFYDGFELIEAAAKWSAIPITGQFYYFLQPTASTPYLTGGVGPYMFEVDYDFSAPGYGTFLSGDISETDFGVNAGVGMMFGDGQKPLRFGIDGRFPIVLTEEESTNIVAVMGRVFF